MVALPKQTKCNMLRGDYGNAPVVLNHFSRKTDLTPA